ncbi:MAG TPA: hypothetical protein VF147_04595 [Vicinamibacterales bacterium]
MTTRHLFEILLPLYDNEGHRFGKEPFETTHAELIDRFGGLTAHMRAPARGVWQSDEGEVTHDDIVIFEVMADDVDEAWWTRYKATLEARFRQDEIIVRVSDVAIL